MNKLKFVGLLIALGLAASAASGNESFHCPVSQNGYANPGQSACRGASTSNMTVQTCDGNSGQWQSSGQKCTCNAPASYYVLNGVSTCTGPYIKS